MQIKNQNKCTENHKTRKKKRSKNKQKTHFNKKIIINLKANGNNFKNKKINLKQSLLIIIKRHLKVVLFNNNHKNKLQNRIN